jgi:hypothetical protein
LPREQWVKSACFPQTITDNGPAIFFQFEQVRE